jgi:subtilase family serine protease
MTRISIHRLFATVALLALCATSTALAQTGPQARITAPIDASSRATLSGSRPPRARAADDMGAVPATLQLHGISLVFSRSPAQQTALDALVAAQQNPASPLYHQWITPDQYAAQFGVAASDIASAESWLEQQGFAIDSVSRSHNRILFSGTAAQVASAFGAPLHYYLIPATALQPAATHFAPSADLSLPAALASSVLSIGNLSDFRLVPHILRSQPRFTSSQTGNHYLTPGDLATIYDITPAYNSGYTGSNQSIAVVGQSAINLSDITNFQTAVGIVAKTPNVILVPGSGTSEIYATGDEAESDLDLEYSSTIAKGAQVYFIYTGNSNSYGVQNSIEYAVDNKTAPIISTSYGQCEPELGQAQYNSENATYEQAAAQGQTVVSAAGDDGSTDCYGEYKSTQPSENEQLAVDFPGSSQYVTSVGGTEFPAADVVSGNNTYFDAQSSTDIISSAKSYIPEMVWNDDVAATAASCPGTTADPCTPISSGGGGVSIFTAQPTWQTGTIGGVAIANNGFRMVPDVALTASPFNAPFAFCTSDKTFWSTGQTSSCTYGLRDTSITGNLTVGGGTSFEAPTVSALVAIINQATNSTGQGVINPTLYSLAATSIYATAFHDITSGGNNCTAGAAYCSSPATTDYPATTGYDEASGLGSIDFFNLLNAWPNYSTTGAASFKLAAANVSVAPASSTTGTLTITPSNGYTGTVNLKASYTALTDGCVVLSSTSVAVTGTTAATASYTVYTSTSACTAAGAARPGAGTAANNSTHPSPWSHLPLPTSLAGAFLFLCMRGRSRKLLTASLSLALVLGLSLSGLGLTGCGGSSSSTGTGSNVTNTPQGTFTITITGTDSATSTLTSNASFTVTVS